MAIRGFLNIAGGKYNGIITSSAKKEIDFAPHFEYLRFVFHFLVWLIALARNRNKGVDLAILRRVFRDRALISRFTYHSMSPVSL